jgi:hypothetical protein
VASIQFRSFHPEAYCLPPSPQRIKQALDFKNCFYQEYYLPGYNAVYSVKAGRKHSQLSRWYLARLILRPWRWSRYVPPKRRSTFNGLHGVISQETVLFITTAMRTSSSTCYCTAYIISMQNESLIRRRQQRLRVSENTLVTEFSAHGRRSRPTGE